tara:strand:- start:1657 stop:2661 length:1005 start_codon:yes stop_codon:yes gene_type:complete
VRRLVDILKQSLIFIYANLINIWLFYNNKNKNYKYIYPNYFNFGDAFIFYLYNYSKIKRKKNNKIIVFGNIDKKIIFLLFSKKKLVFNFFFIFKFLPLHPIQSKLQPLVNFKPEFCDYLKLRNKDSIKNLLNLKIKNNLISKNIEKFKNENYFLIFIKHYNNNIDDLSGSHGRQTADLNKVYELINYLTDKKYQVIIMGDEKDKSLEEIKKFKFNHSEKVSFFKELSEKYSIEDQLYIIKFSKGYIGNGSGIIEPVYFFKKKAVIFDLQFDEENYIHYNLEYRNFLFKKVIINNEKSVLTNTIIKNIKTHKLRYKIIDSPLREIISEINKTFNI